MTASTGYNVVEGTNVTFTCKAAVGAEPQGQLLWYYIIGNPGSLQPISDQAITQSPESYETCSYTRVSTLTLTMTQAFNGVLLRCTLQQSGVSITDDHRQTTDFFNVTCKYFMSIAIHDSIHSTVIYMYNSANRLLYYKHTLNLHSAAHLHGNQHSSSAQIFVSKYCAPVTQPYHMNGIRANIHSTVPLLPK